MVTDPSMNRFPGQSGMVEAPPKPCRHALLQVRCGLPRKRLERMTGQALTPEDGNHTEFGVSAKRR